MGLGLLGLACVASTPAGVLAEEALEAVAAEREAGHRAWHGGHRTVGQNHNIEADSVGSSELKM